MSDESDQDPLPTPRNADPAALGVIAIDEPSEADLHAEGAVSQRSKPPPKPRLPSVRPDARQSPLPPRPSPVPPPRRSSPLPPPSEKASDSIKPMPMIKLGMDSPRSESPPSSIERLSSIPTRPSRVPPPVSPGSVPPRARAHSDRPSDPAISYDAPTEPEISIETTTEPMLSFDVTTDEDAEPETPRSISGFPEGEGASRSAPGRSVPPQRASSPARSAPPPAPSARISVDSLPEIELEPPTIVDTSSHVEIEVSDGDAAEEVPDSELAPGSDEEVLVAEGETLSFSIDVAPPGVELPSEESTTTSRRPPPPPKRGRGSGSLPPSERAVAQALQPPKFEPPTAKPRARPWWEELFTDDFGRGILPPTTSQVRREVDFIEDSLAVAKGGVVLDLACGNGQHAVELSTRGYGVVGFDLSLPQLAVAGELAQERGQKINFLQGDMRDMLFEDVFDGIFCWNTSFGYFEEERNLAVAERVFAALRPGGRFLLDVINRDFVVEQQPSQVWFEGDSCVCMDDMSVDFITSRLRVKRTMMLDDGRTKECTFSIRIYSLHELGKLLHDIGFRVTEASGHPAYPGVFFGAQSPRVVILAQKP
jgi:SAM-dependent methyltransferase